MKNHYHFHYELGVGGREVEMIWIREEEGSDREMKTVETKEAGAAIIQKSFLQASNDSTN